MHRHGKLVFTVCRRVLGTGPDQDDAFQATFAVLATKHAGIRKQGSVASWLYVAYRLALQLKARRTRRQKREGNCGDLDQFLETPAMRVDPAARAILSELGTILDEELQLLPAGWRDALILCHLEGLSTAEAARRLGWPHGTLKGRLQRARERLRQRMQRRGVTLSAMGLALVLTEQAMATVPAKLVRAAVRWAAPKAIPASILALAEGAAPTLVVSKRTLALIAIFAMGLLGLTAGMMPFPAAGAARSTPPRAGQQVGRAEPQAREEAGKRDAFDDALPPGAVARLGTVRWRHGAPPHFVALLPKGEGESSTVVSAAADGFIRLWDLATGKELHRFGQGAPKEPPSGLQILRPLVVAAVSADGKLLAVISGSRRSSSGTSPPESNCRPSILAKTGRGPRPWPFPRMAGIWPSLDAKATSVFGISWSAISSWPSTPHWLRVRSAILRTRQVDLRTGWQDAGVGFPALLDRTSRAGRLVDLAGAPNCRSLVSSGRSVWRCYRSRRREWPNVYT